MSLKIFKRESTSYENNVYATELHFMLKPSETGMVDIAAALISQGWLTTVTTGKERTGVQVMV